MEFFTNIDFAACLAWLEAEVLPHVASVSVVLGVALVELIPAVKALLRARSVFAKVAADAEGYVRDKRDYDARAEARERELTERMDALNTALERLEKSALRTERMLYLGMSNSQELVINGAARKIAQIEEEANENGERDEA